MESNGNGVYTKPNIYSLTCINLTRNTVIKLPSHFQKVTEGIIKGEGIKKDYVILRCLSVQSWHKMKKIHRGVD